MTTKQYDLTKPPKDDAERFARFYAAFKLEYFTRDDDGTEDANLIRRSKDKLTTAPKSRAATIQVDIFLQAAFYQVKLALHIGRIPRPQTDHRNLDWRDHRLDNLREATNQENGRNKLPRSRKDPALARGVRKTKRNRAKPYVVQLRDDDGHKRYFGRYATPEEANAVSRAQRHERDGKFHRESPPRTKPKVSGR
jgi:hypothetical protein